MQGLRKEFSGNRWTDQGIYEGKKGSGSDVVHVLESVVQLFGEKDISLFSNDGNELDKASIGRGKNAGNN